MFTNNFGSFTLDFTIVRIGNTSSSSSGSSNRIVEVILLVLKHIKYLYVVDQTKNILLSLSLFFCWTLFFVVVKGFLNHSLHFRFRFRSLQKIVEENVGGWRLQLYVRKEFLLYLSFVRRKQLLAWQPAATVFISFAQLIRCSHYLPCS